MKHYLSMFCILLLSFALVQNFDLLRKKIKSHTYSKNMIARGQSQLLQTPTGEWFLIRNAESNKCITKGGDTYVRQVSCNINDQNQWWKITANTRKGRGWIYIAAKNGQLLDDRWGSRSSGNSYWVYNPNGTNSQNFFSAKESFGFSLYNEQGRKCLISADNNENTNITQQPCQRRKNMQWNFEKVPEFAQTASRTSSNRLSTLVKAKITAKPQNLVSKSANIQTNPVQKTTTAQARKSSVPVKNIAAKPASTQFRGVQNVAAKPANTQFKSAPLKTAPSPARNNGKAAPQKTAASPARNTAKSAPQKTAASPARNTAKSAPQKTAASPARNTAKSAPQKTAASPARNTAKSAPQKTAASPARNTAKSAPQKTAASPARNTAKSVPQKTAASPARNTAKSVPQKTAASPARNTAKSAPQKTAASPARNNGKAANAPQKTAASPSRNNGKAANAPQKTAASPARNNGKAANAPQKSNSSPARNTAKSAPQKTAASPARNNGKAAPQKTAASPARNNGKAAPQKTAASPARNNGKAAPQKTNSSPARNTAKSAPQKTNSSPARNTAKSAPQKTNSSPARNTAKSAPQKTNSSPARNNGKAAPQKTNSSTARNNGKAAPQKTNSSTARNNGKSAPQKTNSSPARNNGKANPNFGKTSNKNNITPASRVSSTKKPSFTKNSQPKTPASRTQAKNSSSKTQGKSGVKSQSKSGTKSQNKSTKNGSKKSGNKTSKAAKTSKSQKTKISKANKSGSGKKSKASKSGSGKKSKASKSGSGKKSKANKSGSGKKSKSSSGKKSGKGKKNGKIKGGKNTNRPSSSKNNKQRTTKSGTSPAKPRVGKPSFRTGNFYPSKKAPTSPAKPRVGKPSFRTGNFTPSNKAPTSPVKSKTGKPSFRTGNFTPSNKANRSTDKQPASFPFTNVFGTLKLRSTGYCLFNSGPFIASKVCNEEEVAQLFRVEKYGKSYRLFNKNGYVLDLQGSNPQDGSQYWMYPINGTNAQSWSLELKSGTYFSLKCEASNKCLTGSKNNSIFQSSCNTDVDQQFSFKPAGAPKRKAKKANVPVNEFVNIQVKGTRKCLSAISKQGNEFTVEECNPTDRNQKMKFVKTGKAYSISNIDGFMFDLKFSKPDNGNKFWNWISNNTKAQIFKFRDADNGYLKIVTTHKKCVESVENTNVLQQNKCLDVPNQKFKVIRISKFKTGLRPSARKGGKSKVNSIDANGASSWQKAGEKLNLEKGHYRILDVNGKCLKENKTGEGLIFSQCNDTYDGFYFRFERQKDGRYKILSAMNHAVERIGGFLVSTVLSEPKKGQNWVIKVKEGNFKIRTNKKKCIYSEDGKAVLKPCDKSKFNQNFSFIGFDKIFLKA